MSSVESSGKKTSSGCSSSAASWSTFYHHVSFCCARARLLTLRFVTRARSIRRSDSSFWRTRCNLSCKSCSSSCIRLFWNSTLCSMTQAGAITSISHAPVYLTRSLTRVVLDACFKSDNGRLFDSVFLVQKPRQGSSEQTQ